MEPCLTTERLDLRPFGLDDAAAVHGPLDAHPDVGRFDPFEAELRRALTDENEAIARFDADR